MMRLAIALMLIALAPPALSQDGGWVDRLQNQHGGVCCYNSDGRRLDDPEWRTAGNSYEVLFTEGWIKVPETAVVQQRNEDGIARVWNYIDLDQNGTGTRVIRCFLPGSLS
jgi:hypothetical protein